MRASLLMADVLKSVLATLAADNGKACAVLENAITAAVINNENGRTEEIPNLNIGGIIFT
jgi:hypothetical protein